MKMFGVGPADYPDRWTKEGDNWVRKSVVLIWLENEPIARVFLDMGTQWRVGSNGATGLDYGVLPMVMRMAGVAETREHFQQIRVMEREALDCMHAKDD